MDKKNRRRIYHRSIIRTLAAMLAVILMLNTAAAVYAKEAMIPQISGYPLPLSDGAEEKLSDDTTEVRAEGFEIPGDKPEDPDDGKPGDEPKNPGSEQPGSEPEDPDDGQPGDEPEEPDPYVTFAEKYRNGRYKKVAWAEELEVLGGMENVDFVRLIRECGYNMTVGIDYAARNAFEDEDQTVELMTALSSARKTVAKEIVDQADPYLKAHVDEALILKSNPDSLLAFTHTLIDNIIPQTVLVLRENFPAFANAPDEAFSKDLGFEIRTGQDAMGEAANSYEQTNDFRSRGRGNRRLLRVRSRGVCGILRSRSRTA